MKKLSKVFKEMKGTNIELLLGEIGFKPLIGLKGRPIRLDLCRELMEGFDFQSSMIEYNGNKFSFHVEDVEDALGLENKGLDVVDVTWEHNGKDLADFHNISTNVSYA